MKELSKYIWAPRRTGEQSTAPKPRIRMVDIDGMAQATGKRKTAKCFMRIKPGTGKAFINTVPYTEYFRNFTLRQRMLEPLHATGLLSQFDIYAQVHGSGLSSQSGAVQLALARALQNYDPVFRPTLKKHKYLTSDKRNVERKHTGRRKARKSFAWVKR
uniref:30S ribosomal protein S9 n=1 Tax=Lygus hesperus TaxID=30085 RepID=A0A0A9Y1L6_LYGHE